MKHFISHDGEQYIDSFGRTVHQCRQQAKTAATFADVLRQVRDGTESSLTFGREGGPRCLRRLDTNATIYDRMAARDAETVELLEEHMAWLEDVIDRGAVDELRAFGGQHRIGPDAREMIIERLAAEFEAALDRLGLTDTQRARLQREDRGRMTAILWRAECEASSSGVSAVSLVWSLLISGEDPRFEETAA